MAEQATPPTVLAQPTYVMGTELKSLLTANKVAEDIQLFLANEGCTEVGQFSSWIDDIQGEVLNHFPDTHKTSKLQRAGLRQAIAESKIRADIALKRSAEGLDPDKLEEPLQPELQRSMEKTFSDSYRWKLSAEDRGCDSLLGRCRREFERRTVTMFSVMKVKSLAYSHQSQPAKRFKMGDGLEIVAPDEASPAGRPRVKPSSVHEYFIQFRVLVNTWAIAGAYEVTYENTPGQPSTTFFAEWQAVIDYLRVFEDKAWEVMEAYADQDVLHYVLSTEEFMRSKAIELSRQHDHLPWGEALRRALREYSSKWIDAREILRSVPRRKGVATPGAPPAHPAGLLQGGGKQGNKGTNQGGGKGGDKGGGKSTGKGKGALAPTNSSGKEFCKSYNNRQGCSTPCVQGKLHACDVMLVKGNACGAPHKRSEHDATKHGKQKLQ